MMRIAEDRDTIVFKIEDAKRRYENALGKDYVSIAAKEAHLHRVLQWQRILEVYDRAPRHTFTLDTRTAEVEDKQLWVNNILSKNGFDMSRTIAQTEIRKGVIRYEQTL